MGDSDSGIFLSRLRDAVIGCDLENIESIAVTALNAKVDPVDVVLAQHLETQACPPAQGVNIRMPKFHFPIDSPQPASSHRFGLKGQTIKYAPPD